MFSVRESESPTLKYRTESSPISLKTGMSEQIVGIEKERASRTGIPKPSSLDGNTYIEAFL